MSDAREYLSSSLDERQLSPTVQTVIDDESVCVARTVPMR